MIRNKARPFQLLLLYFVLVTSIVSACMVLFDADKPECYSLSFLLPLAFAFCFTLLFFAAGTLDSFTSLIVCGCYFIRMSVLPIIKTLGNYASLASISSLSQYMNTAIILQIYEMIIVFSFLIYIHNSQRIARSDFYQTLSFYDVKSTTLSKYYMFMLISLTAYVLLIIALDNRVITDQFMLIYKPNPLTRKAEYRSISGAGTGVYGLLVTLMCYVFLILQMLLPATLILKHIKSSTNRRRKPSVLYILFIILILLMVMTEERGNTVILVGALLLFLYRVLPNRYKTALFCCIPLVAGIAAFALYNKSGGVDAGFDMDKASIMVSSYFLGTENIAASIAAGKSLSLLGTPKQIVVDFLHSVPILSSIISDYLPVSSSVLFGQSIYDTIITTGRTDQLMSPIGQGYQYFGFLLAPIIPCLLIRIPFWFEKKGIYANNLISKCVCVSAAIFLSFQAVNNNSIIIFPKFLMFYIAYRIAKRGVTATADTGQ